MVSLLKKAGHAQVEAAVPSRVYLRRQTKGSKISGEVHMKVDSFEEQMSISLQLLRAKYACSEGWEAPELRSSASSLSLQLIWPS